jgi:DNA polymerase V
MGQPFFEWQHLLRQHKVHVFSPNFPLYGDLSARTMAILHGWSQNVEVYSIDEAFFILNKELIEDTETYCHQIRDHVKQWIGMPVSIGIAKTRTLAKVANELAKKHPEYKGVLELNNNNTEACLKKLPVGDVWGVGRRTGAKLKAYSIETAYDLIQKPDAWIKQKLTISGLRMVHELRGTSCIEIDEAATDKKHIISSRSFGRAVEKLSELKEAVASYTARATEKLRSQHSMATVITVYARTSAHTDSYYGKSHTTILPEPTNHTPTLIKAAHLGLEKIYEPGFRYKKAGIALSKFIPETVNQLNLFETDPNRQKKQTLLKLIDGINLENGRHCLNFASTGFKKPWRMKQDFRSPNYTADWNQLLKIKI